MPMSCWMCSRAVLRSKLFPRKTKSSASAATTRRRAGNFANYFVIVFDRPFSAYGVWTPEAVQAGVNDSKASTSAPYLKFDTSASSGRVQGGLVVHQPRTGAAQPCSRKSATPILTRSASAPRRAGTKLSAAPDRGRRRGPAADVLQRALPQHFVSAPLLRVRREQAARLLQPLRRQGARRRALHRLRFLGHVPRRASALQSAVPEVSAEILQGLLNAYDESGWLPSWSSPGHRDCMIGNHAFSLLADGWVKASVALTRKRRWPRWCTTPTRRRRSLPGHRARRRGVLQQAGLRAVSECARRESFREAAAKTLEYAYDDFCAARLARAAGRKAEAAVFARRR